MGRLATEKIYRYLIVDNDTGIICASITELVSQYEDPRSKAEETVAEMNRNLGVNAFRVEEAPSNVTYILSRAEEKKLEAQTEEEAYLVTQLLNTGLGETAFEMHPLEPSRVIYLCNRK